MAETAPRPRAATPYWLCAPALVLLAVLLAVPMLMTFLLSFNAYSDTAGIIHSWSLTNYQKILSDPYFASIFLRTLRLALVTTIASALIGVPEAYIISRLQPRWRSLCLVVVLGPLLVSVVVRTLGWQILLARTGLINQVLVGLGILPHPVDLLFTETGMDIAMTHVMVPYMVLAVWTSIRQIDPRTAQAAQSLGASGFTCFRRIVLPQIVPGILSGSIIVFSLTASSFATPELIGGRREKVAATTIYDQFLTTLNWPEGAAIACLLIVAIMVIVFAWNRLLERRYAAVTA
ncbi:MULTISPECIES: ABC transporter permease [Acidocella]|uniref:ABC transporter permease n=1 Tax=Acidocella TaxID=50709 RepID=UPI00028D5F64|nr:MULTISPECIES: ABC transporter permease [Acidocella]EKN01433.1 mannopine ABC transporter permease [Acidocella sp. MX-AZ02]